MIKIVTDNASDIPLDIAHELGISIIPLYVCFDKESYRENVDINIDQFYQKLIGSKDRPTTSTPSPGDFIALYEKLSRETDTIISIHLSSQYSSTCNVARLSADYVKDKCRVEVVDSLAGSVALGLIVIAAARASQRGANLKEVMEIIHWSIPHVHLFAVVTDLNYAIKGSRLNIPVIGANLAKMGKKLNAKIFGEILDGKPCPVGAYFRDEDVVARLERKLADYQIHDIAVVYSTLPPWEPVLNECLSRIPRRGHFYHSRYGCMTGIQSGPCASGIAIIERDT